ncbi:MAG: serine hydrolase, partial [Oscillospiraceae bacterium]|nr:serine hydrolase [Oscillospiraceae bacterium]
SQKTQNSQNSQNSQKSQKTLKARKKKRRKLSSAGILALFVLLLVMILGICGMIHLLLSPSAEKENSNPDSALILESESTEPPTEEPTTEPPTEPPPMAVYPSYDADTVKLDDNISSQYAILVDSDQHKVLAQKDGEAKIYPASMTKLMTLIVAIEHTENFEDKFTMTQEILSDLYAQSASMAGFSADEECSIMDLLYGAALPSGADATTGLAVYTAGSEEAFVRLMNEKVQELGLHNTHFMNASGLHDENHYSTPTDIATILEYCLQNEICKKVISTYTYTTSSTEQHPDGIMLYDTMFNKMTGTEVQGITILGGKTGYTDEAGQCLASYAQTPDGHCYIAVTSKVVGKYEPVFDAFKLYGTITGTYPMGEEDSGNSENSEDPGESDSLVMTGASADMQEIPAA